MSRRGMSWLLAIGAAAGSAVLAGCGTVGQAQLAGDPSMEHAVALPSVSLPPSTPAAEPTTPRGTRTERHDFRTIAPGWERTAVAGAVEVPDAKEVTCPVATLNVDTSAELAEALASARPGTVIKLAPNRVFRGEFRTTRSGSASRPMWLCGSTTSVLDAGSTSGGYVLHLDGASHWRVIGFQLRNGQKGLVADRTQRSVFQGLRISGIGDEALHLRANSSDNVVQRNRISGTGLRRDDFGEGVYVGSAMSNWCTYTNCRPDRSDRNVISGNTITGTGAESVDIKEGTTGGRLLDNVFDGAGMTGADSWVDVKGNAWLVEGNKGVDAPEDGFQTHEILDGWGDRNLFRDNVAHVNASGYGFALRPILDNRVTCDNVAYGATALSNAACRG